MSDPKAGPPEGDPARGDPARERPQRPERPKLKTDLIMNIDLPYTAYKINSPTGESGLLPGLKRPGFNSTGKEIDLLVNAYPITKFPTRPVYQYEINVLHDRMVVDNKRIMRKCWNSPVREKKLPDAIWDGNRLAWSFADYPEFNEFIHEVKGGVTRPLDVAPSPENVNPTMGFQMSIRRNRKINLGVIKSWIQGAHDMDEHVLEAFNFLDHLLRAWPNTKFVAIKRSYFFGKEIADSFSMQLSNMACSVYRGIYQAIRPSLRGLILNVDVAHTVFYSQISLMGIMRQMYRMRDDQQLMSVLKFEPDGYGGRRASQAMVTLNSRIQGLRVCPNYEGCPFKDKGFIVKGMIVGLPREFMIDVKDPATGVSERMSIQKYFLKKYNVYLEFPDMPLVEMTKQNIVYPAEFLVVKGLQKYRNKLLDTQVADMIKFTATRPPQRLKHIQEFKAKLGHDEDPILKKYGMAIGGQMMKIKARLLPNPEIQFGNNQKHNPGTTGRWDLRGKKFFKPNAKPLQCWGVGFFAGQRSSVTHDQTLRFLDQFMKIYAQHGGKVVNRPHVVELTEDIGHAVKKLYEQTKAKWNKEEPQLLMFVLPSKDMHPYERVKKSCDCRFGVPSQCLQSIHVTANRPQYHSNVLMKVNAKLGGTTARAISRVPGATLRPQSMIIGADVTHPHAGVWTPSLAAMTVSADAFAGRYMGGCESNGDRVEIISEPNIYFILQPLVREWFNIVGGRQAPKCLYYFRDGVSESEYSAVLKEAQVIKFVVSKVCNTVLFEGKMCVVVANKRHHLRGFPNPNDRNSADRNGNPLPGTLMEREITSPHDWDFLLYSHIALQGTARPVHYHVLLDEIGHQAHELENMIYEHCYQYIRSTTSVSMHPAVYYAHLIATRARHHEDVPASSGPQHGPTIRQSRPKPKGDERKALPTLLPIEGGDNNLALQMWYI